MGGPKQQERAEATRGHLLDAARTVFAERGYQATSVAAITAAAATAHGTFYLYFRNKEDAFGEVMTEMLDELYRHSFTPFDELGDRFDADRNRERIAAYVGVYASNSRLWRALLEAVLASPAIEAAWLAQRARFQEGMAGRMRRFQAHGTMRDVDVDDLAGALGGMLEWFAFTGVAFEASGPLETSERMVDLISDVWARAIDGAVGHGHSLDPVAAEPVVRPPVEADRRRPARLI